jgi:hypothetical protein
MWHAAQARVTVERVVAGGECHAVRLTGESQARMSVSAGNQSGWAVMENGGRCCKAYGQAEGTSRGSELIVT